MAPKKTTGPNTQPTTQAPQKSPKANLHLLVGKKTSHDSHVPPDKANPFPVRRIEDTAHPNVHTGMKTDRTPAA